MIAVLIVFHAANEKTWNKTILKKDSRSRKEDQNVVVVANPPGSSSLYCRTDITPLSHRYHYAVALLSLRCCNAIVPLMRHFCYASVAPLSRCCHTAIAPLPFRCRSAAVAPLSRRCHAAVAPLSHRYHSTVALMLSLLLSLHSRTAIPTLSHHCRSAAVAPAVATQSLLISPPLSLCCCAIVASLLLRCRFCHSVAADVAPAVATVSLVILLLLSLTVVPSRGRIRVTVFIGDCQACVSSSSEGCLTLQKTVKVGTY